MKPKGTQKEPKRNEREKENAKRQNKKNKDPPHKWNNKKQKGTKK